MNIPVNFNKIDGEKFNIGSCGFVIEVDYAESGDVWVTGDHKWPLCFDIDWQKGEYALIKCRPGDGRHGDVLVSDAPLVKFLMKDANSFVHTFLKDIVSTLLNNNII